MKLFVIMPIYNIKVDDDVIDTEIIDGYKLITNSTFFDSYGKEIMSNEKFINHPLYEDILIPQAGMPCLRNTASYVLIKLIKEFEVEENYVFNRELAKSFMIKERANLDHFILSLRLVQKGRCRFNRFYIFTKISSESYLTSFSTNIEDIGIVRDLHNNIFEEEFLVSKEIVDKIKQIQVNLKNVFTSKELSIPIMYFMQYYSTNNLYDGLIKLAIVLESSVLAGIREGELGYRLKIRVSAFLKQDCSEILGFFYNLRSDIVHNGTISTKHFNDIKKFIKDCEYSNLKALFIFLSDYIEPLVRKVLCRSLEEFTKQEIKNYIDLFSSVDKKCFEVISGQ